eukprot:gnl/MRDRNA2_/MRDRNA2_23817_c0_seq1.p1 gnl/MRDRNA2_/MRDRNA2_23817_c0~~gnl/MRDRNA2_/MRDRNA2_23817_c0_seq1.p1  ORF type:complete len:320 (+),score=67.51 gnl/MRDRNA2_/MRDRNA2_23817_c0_seq1:101-961(+)
MAQAEKDISKDHALTLADELLASQEEKRAAKLFWMADTEKNEAESRQGNVFSQPEVESNSQRKHSNLKRNSEDALTVQVVIFSVCMFLYIVIPRRIRKGPADNNLEEGLLEPHLDRYVEERQSMNAVDLVNSMNAPITRTSITESLLEPESLLHEPETSQATDAHTVAVTFSVLCRTHFGGEVGVVSVVGSALSLGEGNPQGALAMRWSEGDTWVATVNLELADEPIEYRYVLMSDGHAKKWEECERRRLHIPASESSVVCKDVWGGNYTPELAKEAEVNDLISDK